MVAGLPLPIVESRWQCSHLPVKGKQMRGRIAELFDLIKKKTSFGDALVLSVAKKQLPSASMMVTWDADYLKEKFEGDVLSPAEFQERLSA